MDQIKKPSIDSPLKQGTFLLHIYAYRVLSVQERIKVAAEFCRTKKLRTLPKSGEATVFTTIGADGV